MATKTKEKKAEKKTVVNAQTPETKQEAKEAKAKKKEKRVSKLRGIVADAISKPIDLGDLQNPLNEFKNKMKRAFAVAIVGEARAIAEKKNYDEAKTRELIVRNIAASGILYKVDSDFTNELEGHEIEATRYAAWAEQQVGSENGYAVQQKEKVEACRKFARALVRKMIG